MGAKKTQLALPFGLNASRLQGMVIPRSPYRRMPCLWQIVRALEIFLSNTNVIQLAAKLDQEIPLLPHHRDGRIVVDRVIDGFDTLIANRSNERFSETSKRGLPFYSIFLGAC